MRLILAGGCVINRTWQRVRACLDGIHHCARRRLSNTISMDARGFGVSPPSAGYMGSLWCVQGELGMKGEDCCCPIAQIFLTRIE